MNNNDVVDDAIFGTEHKIRSCFKAVKRIMLFSRIYAALNLPKFGERKCHMNNVEVIWAFDWYRNK